MKCYKCGIDIEMGNFLKPRYAPSEVPLEPYCTNCAYSDKSLTYHGIGMYTMPVSTVRWLGPYTFEYDGDVYDVPVDAPDSVWDDIALYPEAN